MAAPVETGLTVGDLQRFAEDERRRYELIGGELFVSPKGQLRHQLVLGRVFARMLEHIDGIGGVVLPEPDVYYTERDYVVPDIVVVSAETAARLDPSDVLRAPPELIVEVSSPSTRRHDVVRKRALYERHGVAEYWFVDLDADRVEVLVLVDGRYRGPVVVEHGAARATVFPGLAVELADILRPFGAAPPERA